MIKESQRNIKQTQIKLKEKITKLEKEISAIEKRTIKYQKALETTDEMDIVKVLARNISSSEDKLNETTIELSKLKIDYELQNEKFNQTLLEMTYYDVKEQINNWFFKLNVEEQRNELIKIIKVCKIFNHYIIIDTGNIVFLFDIDQHYVFDMKLLENLNKDEVYKTNFIEMKNKKQAKTYNEKLIADIDLTKGENTRMLVFQYLIEKLNVIYNLNNTSNLVSFTSLRGLYSLAQWPLDTKG
jgi:hypothetical protein